MSKHPLAIVCALAFLVGGASAFVLEYAPRAAEGGRDITETGADVGHAPADSEEAEARPDEPVRAEGIESSEVGHAFPPRPYDASVEPTRTGGEFARAVKPSGRVRGQGSADGRAGEGRGAARGYAKGSSGAVASGGQGIAGHAVGGIKKTGGGVKKAGAAIGKTFGKIGGVFHD